MVRVERPRAVAPDPVRLCPLINPDERRLVCYGGPAPELGTHFTLIDDQGVRGVATAERTEASSQDPCKLGSAHDVLVDYDEARGLAPRPGFSFTVALSGVALEDGARVVRDVQLRSPSGKDAQQVWMAVDRNGDGEPDVAVTAFECSDQVHDLPVAPSGQQVHPYCLDYWVKEDVDWHRVNRDVFFTCM